MPEEIGEADTVLADAGCFSESNVEACEDEQLMPYIAVQMEYHNQHFEQRFPTPGFVSDDADPITKMKYHLRAPEERKLYVKRKSTVEPVFDIIKNIMGFRQFLLRGADAVQGEWDLVYIAWNLKRMHALNT